MNVSEYMVKYLKSRGVDHFFGYQGTMIAYFVDAVGRDESVKNHVCYNEQGAALAACGYAKSTGRIAAAYSTSGPGAINLLQGIADAYYDSVPVLFITGQLNISEYTSNSGVRQQGFQETDIVGICRPITKLAVQIRQPEEILSVLPRALRIMMDGRRGPVLIDIPMDIQKAVLEVDEHVCSKMEVKCAVSEDKEVTEAADTILEKLAAAKAPVFVFGSGVNLDDKTRQDVNKLVRKYKIPSFTTMLAVDLLESRNPYRFGFVGYAYGNRSANFILDLKADLILSFGARLCSRQIGVDRKNFARSAQVIRIDIDENELKQGIHQDDINYPLDADQVIQELLARDVPCDFSEWNEKCSIIRKKLVSADENHPYRKPNEMIRSISALIPENSTIACDVGQHQIWLAQSFDVKADQRILFSGGHGAMGFALPAAAGSAFDERRHHYCFVGDGSLQMNIQELQWIVSENIPVKIFVLNNHSLGLIRQQQDSLFQHRYYGAAEEFGFAAPSFAKIASAYGINSMVLEQSRYPEWDMKQLSLLIGDAQPWLVEINLDKETYALPKTQFGQKMHNQYPYVREEVFRMLLEL